MSIESEDPLLSPFQYMALVEGPRHIPISVTAVLAFGFVSSSMLVNARPWTTSPGGAWDTASDAVSKSRVGGRLLLLVYRCYALLHIAVVLGVMLQNRKLTFLLHFFTNWTYILEGLYFLFAAISSALALRKKPAGTVGRLGFTVITMFHVTLAAALMLDTLTWTILWPMLSRTSDPKALAHHKEATFSWISFNTHIFNALFMLVELLLNSIPFHPYLLGFGGLYSSSFGLWAFSFYHRTGRWIYPFLNASKPWAPFMWTGIYLGHWAFFGLVAVLFMLRDRLLGTKAVAVEMLSGTEKQD